MKISTGTSGQRCLVSAEVGGVCCVCVWRTGGGIVMGRDANKMRIEGRRVCARRKCEGGRVARKRERSVGSKGSETGGVCVGLRAAGGLCEYDTRALAEARLRKGPSHDGARSREVGSGCRRAQVLACGALGISASVTTRHASGSCNISPGPRCCELHTGTTP